MTELTGLPNPIRRNGEGRDGSPMGVPDLPQDTDRVGFMPPTRCSERSQEKAGWHDWKRGAES